MGSWGGCPLLQQMGCGVMRHDHRQWHPPGPAAQVCPALLRCSAAHPTKVRQAGPASGEMSVGGSHLSCRSTRLAGTGFSIQASSCRRAGEGAEVITGQHAGLTGGSARNGH